MNYVYIEFERGLFTVGFYRPCKMSGGKDGLQFHNADRLIWTAESDHIDWRDAAARVSYLNGGALSHHDSTVRRKHP